MKIGELGYEFRNIGLDKIQFITIPTRRPRPTPTDLVWTPAGQAGLAEDRQRPAAHQAVLATT